MQVFEMYFKLLKKHIPLIFFLFIIFIGVTLYISLFMKDDANKIFQEKRIDIGFINEDVESEVIAGFYEFLDENCNLVLWGNEKTVLEGFNKGEIAYVIKVPMGFSKAFLDGDFMEIKRIRRSMEAKQEAIDLLINRFFQIGELYRDNIDNLTQGELLDYIKVNQNKEVEVNLHLFTEKNKHEDFAEFCNYMSCALTAILILGIALNRLSFNRIQLKNRSIVAPIKTFRISLEILLGDFVFTLICFSVLFGIGIAIISNFKWNQIYLYFIMNTLVFLVSILLLGVLVGTFITKKIMGIIVAIALALGFGYLGGVFSPRPGMSEIEMKMGQFIPTYWYVKVNEIIGGYDSFAKANLSEFYGFILIQFGFAVSLFSIVMVIHKTRTNIRKNLDR
jgi:ABC-2 type transport system permease protein